MPPPIYDESSIQRLTPREHIRLRPGMYVGGTDSKALHHLLFEVLAHSIDEAMANKCDRIEVALRSHGEIRVHDNSEGIPVQQVNGTDKSTFEAVMTVIGTCGGPVVFDQFHVVGGLHGVGLPAVNALCAHMTAEVRRAGFLWRQSYREGTPQTPLEQVRPLADDEPTGNTFTFTPDFTILVPNEFDYETIAERCRAVAYVIKGLKVELRDERTDIAKKEIFFAPDGIQNWVEALNRDRQSFHEVVTQRQVFVIELSGRDPSNLIVEIAFQYTTDTQITLLSYVNTTRVEAGTHIEGFKSALVNRASIMSGKSGQWDDIASGLTAVINIFHPFPAFESNMRYRIINPELLEYVAAVVEDAFANAADPATRNLFASLPTKKSS